jgi:serine/threonine-protein kinase
VKVLDDDVAEDGALFLVTKLLTGETLEARRERLGGKLPERDVLRTAYYLLDVIAAAHDSGVLHRDIKPENTYLTSSGVVKVLDFGIARLRELSSEGNATRSGAAMGTPAYMAPEQARGLWEEVDASSDLWAIGATMFELLAGRSVHEGRTSQEVLLFAMTQHAPALATVVPNVSAKVATVVDRALRFEKAERWTNARDMQAAVLAAWQELEEAPLALPLPPSAPPFEALGEKSVPGRWTPKVSSVFSLPAPAPAAPTPTPPPAEPTGIEASLPLVRRRRTVVAISALVVLALGVGWAIKRLAADAPPTPSSVQAAPSGLATQSAALPVVTLAPPVPSEAPANSAPLPAPAPSPTAPRVARPSGDPGRSAPARTATPATPRPECTPPFVVDPVTGKKTWKTECL